MESVYNGFIFLLRKVMRKISLVFRKICSRHDVKKNQFVLTILEESDNNKEQDEIKR